MRRFAFAVLCLYIATITLETAVRIAGVGTLSRTVGITAFGLTCIGILTFRFRIRRLGLPFVAIGLLVLVYASSIAWSIEPSVSKRATATLVQLVASAWLIWEHGQDSSRRTQLLTAFALGAVAASGLALLNRVAGLVVEGTLYRYSALGLNPNRLAYIAAAAAPICWHLATQGGARWRNRLFALAVPLCCGAVLLTASRTGVIVMAIGLLYGPLTLWRGGVVRAIGFVVPVVLFTYVVLPLLSKDAISRTMQVAELVTHGTRRSTMPMRMKLWRAGGLGGIPGLSLPCGFTGAGLPVGLQLEAAWWQEPTLLRTGVAYQSATDWHRARPPLSGG